MYVIFSLVFFKVSLHFNVNDVYNCLLRKLLKQSWKLKSNVLNLFGWYYVFMLKKGKDDGAATLPIF